MPYRISKQVNSLKKTESFFLICIIFGLIHAFTFFLLSNFHSHFRNHKDENFLLTRKYIAVNVKMT